MLNGKSSNLCNVKKTDIDIRADSNVLKGITVKHARILVLIIKKRIPDDIQKMDHLAIRTGLDLTTRNIVFGFLLKSDDKLSSIALNVILLSALKRSKI